MSDSNLSMWVGSHDYTLPWKTVAFPTYEELVEALISDYRVFTGIHVRKIPKLGLQFYAYVLRESPPLTDRIRPISKEGIANLRGEGQGFSNENRS